MAVTTYNITYTEVFATIAHETASLVQPDTTQMTAWILGFSAEVNVALRAAGLDPAALGASSGALDPDLYSLLRLRITARAAAEWMAANQDNWEPYEAIRAEWQAFLIGLRTTPGFFGSDQPTSGVPALVLADATTQVFETTATGRRLVRSQEWN